jgi:hypothetical protein
MTEMDVRLFVHENLKDILTTLSLKLKEKVEYVADEFYIKKYNGRGKPIYGGGRPDLLFKTSTKLIPVELKVYAREQAYHQVSRYADLLEENYNTDTFKVIIAYQISKNLREIIWDDVKNEKIVVYELRGLI